MSHASGSDDSRDDASTVPDTPLTTALIEACPGTAEVPDDYRQACRLLSVSAPPETLLTASYAVAACGSLLTLLVIVTVTGPLATTVSLGLLTLSLSVAALGRYGVPFVAEAKRIRTLGTAPSLVTTLVLGAALWPSAERAAAFAGRAGDGLLATRLEHHRQRATGTPRTGLGTFAASWGDRFPALERAVGLVENATAAPAEERPEVLDRARQCILDGTHDEMAAFAASLRGPATGLYAFGVLLPLAMVSLLPAASAAGVPVTASVLIGTYGVVLPAVLLVACCWLLGRRPVAFPSATVSRSHPDVPASAVPSVVAGIVAGIGGWLIAGALVAEWASLVGALGAGLGSALVSYYRPITEVRDHVTAIESGLPDALSAVGRRLDRGQSVEAALVEAIDETPEPTSGVIEAAVARQERLGTSVKGAFLGPGGALADVPSHRTRRAAMLLDTAATIGPPAGESVTTMGEHLDALRAIERETRRDLSQITETLSNTAALFGPLIGGATVALAGSMGGGEQFATVPSALLGPVVGWYVLVLAVSLTTLSTGLHRGLDRAFVGYRTGLALLSATVTFLVAVIATGLLV
ncbi:type II secretion system protein [Haloarcula sp. CBA1130]|uniref:type II secretion system F family protein n=1 Tax=unclassified Haloarcula TaxID=2624677 RepID=UPI0012461830|nr:MULTISPECIES: type II secretion system protein [unclassified Haloarcula]KAA9396824.1 type II secretion system protein [Haloarcula sp. CBA1129]KAA9401785.1 type II secretion system protein [Haloarcula sp. CBA1130]